MNNSFKDLLAMICFSVMVTHCTGCNSNHSFWVSPAQDWTTKKAWQGDSFPKDHAVRY